MYKNKKEKTNMGKKKTGAFVTSPPKKEKPMIIDMTKVELAKSYKVAGFKTGKYMTEKDRPRKKNWKKEYQKNRKGLERDNDFNLFLLQKGEFECQKELLKSSFGLIVMKHKCYKQRLKRLA